MGKGMDKRKQLEKKCGKSWKKRTNIEERTEVWKERKIYKMIFRKGGKKVLNGAMKKRKLCNEEERERWSGEGEEKKKREKEIPHVIRNEK